MLVMLISGLFLIRSFLVSCVWVLFLDFGLVLVCRVLWIFLEMYFNVLFKELRRGSNIVIDELFLLFWVEVMFVNINMRLLIKFWLYSEDILIFLVDIK